MVTDEEILKGCINGDRKLQRELYERFAGKMYVVCLRYCKARAEAEDILQEAFIKVFQHLGKFKGESKLETWIKRIVINTALNHHRSKLYLYPMVDVEQTHLKEEYRLPVEQYDFRELLVMLQELPTGCQVIFNLYAIEGYQHNEIASLLNISSGTSKSQYARARKLLQDMILNDQNRSIEGYGEGQTR